MEPPEKSAALEPGRLEDIEEGNQFCIRLNSEDEISAQMTLDRSSEERQNFECLPRQSDQVRGLENLERGHCSVPGIKWAFHEEILTHFMKLSTSS